MLKPNEIEAFGAAYDEPMKELEMRIMQDIVRRIKINGEITRSADWQINRLYELGVSKREIKKYIKDSLRLNTKEINHLYKDIIRKDYERSKELYKYKGKVQMPFKENLGLQLLISAVSEQTYKTLTNITQSLGFAVRQPDGKLKFLPIAEYYQKTLDGAMLDIASGTFDYNTVLKRVVSEMSNSGLRTVDYATGWSNRVDVAARRAVMTGMSQLTAKVNEDNAEQLGTDFFEVSYHGGARPSHQVWQGRVYSKEQLVSVCGLGTVTGLCGANCYHDYYPFIPGLSERTYTDEELDRLNAEENTPKEFGGRKYTKYEALQRQRRLETTMRAQRQQIKLLKDGGANEDDLINARARYRVTSAEYARFSEAMGLPQQRERVTVDGLGNIGAGKYKSGSGTSGGTFAKTSKAETESKNKIQTLDYLTRKKGKPDLLMSAGVDKSEVSENNDNFERNTNQHYYIEVQDEYENNATPGEGNFTFDEPYDKKSHKEEIEFAEWLYNKYGGDLHLIEEKGKPDGEKSPDYLWNNKLWDLKTIATEKAANGAVRRGYNQIEKNPGGIMLNLSDDNISIKDLIQVIEKRMKWYKGETIDIMIVSEGQVIKVLRYKK